LTHDSRITSWFAQLLVNMHLVNIDQISMCILICKLTYHINIYLELMVNLLTLKSAKKEANLALNGTCNDAACRAAEQIARKVGSHTGQQVQQPNNYDLCRLKYDLARIDDVTKVLTSFSTLN
jgi:hypothetical protein